MKRKAYSLQGRLAWVVLGMLVSAWILSAVVVWFDARHEVEEILDSHLAQAAALVVGQARQDVHVGGGRIDMPDLHRYAYKTAIQVYRGDRLLLRSANAPETPLTGAGPGRENDGAGFRTVEIAGSDWRVFSVDDAPSGLRVLVGEAARARNAILTAVLRSTLWPTLVALPLLMLAVWWALRRGLAPMRRLGRVLVERRPDAVDRLRLDDAPAEMVPLVDALNALFERIEMLLVSERRFTADAAHELRTPIAGIRAHAQVALHEADGGLRRHALQSTLDGCDRATRLVEQLLTLSRLDAETSLDEQAVEMRGLVRDVLAAMAPGALGRRQSLALEDGPACAMSGDETLLAVLVRNLVDNAIRHSPPGAQVQVSVECDGADVTLTVEDSGPGLAEADLARVGERFFRALGTLGSGSGLGMSIVHRIAAAHRMSVEVGRSAALGGLRVRVRGAAA